MGARFMTPQKAIELASAPLTFGVPIDRQRSSAVKLLAEASAIANRLARDPGAYVGADFGRLTKTTLDYTLRYPKYCPVAHAWRGYI